MTLSVVIGRKEVEALQAEGWRVIMFGPECANGWPVVFRHEGSGRTRGEVLSNNLALRPDNESAPQDQLALGLEAAQ